MNIRVRPEQVFVEDPRVSTARSQPHRRDLEDPLDPRSESPLGRMRVRGLITEGEYQAGVRWRNVYHKWLHSIGAPNPFPAAVDANGSFGRQNPLDDGSIDDELAEAIQRSMRAGEKALKKLGPRVFHAVNAVAVYEEPEELGDYELTSMAAKRGLAALVEVFG